MDNISFFLNNRTVSKDSFSISDVPVAFGDWCLSPVRYLFDGNKVTISNTNGSLTLNHQKEYTNSGCNCRNFLRVIASIILIIPGAIIGSIFKGLGYLSSSIRERHNLTIQHFRPVNHTIGSLEARLSLDEIKQRLGEIRQANNLQQPIKNLVVYAQEGTIIDEDDPGFMALNPEKIILVGVDFPTSHPWHPLKNINPQSLSISDRLKRLEELHVWPTTSVDQALEEKACDSRRIYLIQSCS